MTEPTPTRARIAACVCILHGGIPRSDAYVCRLAIVCAITGHKFYAVMSKGNSLERARMMAALGAEVVLVDQAPTSVPGQVSGLDLDLVRRRTEELTGSLGAFRADQFRMDSNRRAHLLHTGPEIWAQSSESIDAFVDFAGSAGTFAGCAAFFKGQRKPVRCYVVEPATAAVLAPGAAESSTTGSHRIQGGGYSLGLTDLPLLEPSHIDGFLRVRLLLTL
jgi:cysteine synthase A